MKVKMIKFSWLIMAMIAAFLCFKQFDYYVDNKSNSPLALVDVETLADDEYGHLPPCFTFVEYSEHNQKCNYGGLSYEIIGREISKYVCNAKGDGSCQKGEVIIYYDCFGVRVDVSNNVSDFPCKGDTNF